MRVQGLELMRRKPSSPRGLELVAAAPNAAQAVLTLYRAYKSASVSRAASVSWLAICAVALVNDLVQAVVPIEALSSNRAITTDEA